MKDEDGVFEFYTPTATNPPMPSTTLWAGGGSYPLVLSTMAGDQHLYTAGKELTDPTAMATTFNFTGSTGTADWSDFKALPSTP
jgi:hypothetical protein